MDFFYVEIGRNVPDSTCPLKNPLSFDPLSSDHLEIVEIADDKKCQLDTNRRLSTEKPVQTVQRQTGTVKSKRRLQGISTGKRSKKVLPRYSCFCQKLFERKRSARKTQSVHGR